MDKLQTFTEIKQVQPHYKEIFATERKGALSSGVCGFDGFIDTFIRMETPSRMSEFGSKVSAAAGISTSFKAQYLGDKFGGNGPLLASALHSLGGDSVAINYIGALGENSIQPIFQEALVGKMKSIYTLAEPAHSECIEFNDGKVMLCDLSSCADITWEKLKKTVGQNNLTELLSSARFIAAVNWGKLPHAGEIWENIAKELERSNPNAHDVIFFMDLAEFEQRPKADCLDLVDRIRRISDKCHSILSLNLKEAWQMGDILGLDFNGNRDPKYIALSAAKIREALMVARVIVHPNDGAACASADGVVYLAGPHCKEPLISTGAGDHFGAGCIVGALSGQDNLGILLHGVCTSGYFVRSGISPNREELDHFLTMWNQGALPERLESVHAIN